MDFHKTRALNKKYHLLTIRQIMVLYCVVTMPDIKGRALGRYLKIPGASVSRAYDRLCIDGLMKRVRSDEDARDVFGRATDAGNKLVRELLT